jgi:hypothetical protein
MIDAQGANNLEDIDQFVSGRLKTPNLAERLTASRLPLQLIQGKLREKAEGNFLYVVQALKDIECDIHSFSRLDELPQGLNQWYEAWFRRRFPIPKASYRSARQLLEVILLAYEPLSLEMVASISGLDIDYELPQLLSLLGQYIRHTNRGLLLYHKSLADWLLLTNGEYRVSARTGHRKLADYCLRELGRLRSCTPVLNISKHSYARHALRHLGEIEDWADYMRLMEDDFFDNFLFETVHSFELFPEKIHPIRLAQSDGWSLVQGPELILPPTMLQLPTAWRVNLSLCHMLRFARAAKKLYDDYSLDQLPDYRRPGERLRDTLDGFSDACYAFMLRCSMAVAFAELALEADESMAAPRIKNLLHINKVLFRTLEAIDRPGSTGLTGQHADLTSCVIDRWHKLFLRVSS